MGGKLLILLALGMSLILQGLIRYIVKKKKNIENILSGTLFSSLLSLKKLFVLKRKNSSLRMGKNVSF